MVKEIYIRDKSDPNFEPGIIEYSNDIESAISQIRMILGTSKGDVLGAYELGVDLEYLVFNTVKNTMEVKKLITDQIYSYAHIGKNLSVDVDVQFGDSGHGYDVAVVDIIINGRKALGILVNKD